MQAHIYVYVNKYVIHLVFVHLYIHILQIIIIAFQLCLLLDCVIYYITTLFICYMNTVLISTYKHAFFYSEAVLVEPDMQTQEELSQPIILDEGSSIMCSVSACNVPPQCVMYTWPVKQLCKTKAICLQNGTDYVGLGLQGVLLLSLSGSFYIRPICKLT